MDTDYKSRVFVSCSQQKGTDDEHFAKWIAEFLREKGYDPYIAIQEQTLRGLKENLFDQIASSDYFLFIDFPREKLVSDQTKARGSLFSHQELAVAAYLGLDVVAFQHKDVIHTDGMLSILQTNPIMFESIFQLINGLIDDGIKNAGWMPNISNSLQVTPYGFVPVVLGSENGMIQVQGADGPPQQATSNNFLLAIENRSKNRTALQCAGYLTRCIWETQGFELEYETAELKWAGVPTPISTVNIFPQQRRLMDAFSIPTHNLLEARFNFITDSSLTQVACLGEGSFLIEYAIVAVNFNEVRKLFRLTLGNETRLESIERGELLSKEYPKERYQFYRRTDGPFNAKL